MNDEDRNTPDGIWYHGSNKFFKELREKSTITQWKELAEAFSHQPSVWDMTIMVLFFITV